MNMANNAYSDLSKGRGDGYIPHLHNSEKEYVMPVYTSNRRSRRLNPAIVLASHIYTIANALERTLRQHPRYTLVQALHSSDILKHIAQRIVPLIVIDDTTVGIDSF